MVDQDLIQSRIDFYIEKGFLTYETIYPYALRSGTLFLILKIFSMYDLLSFPIANAANIRNANLDSLRPVYMTESGYKEFCKRLANISRNLFEMVAPSHANHFTPLTFTVKDTRTKSNMLGKEGKKRSQNKKTHTYVVLVDNSSPFDYLKSEYQFSSNYDARMFINKLLRFLPSTRMEYYSIRLHKGSHVREQLPLVTTKAVYK